MNTKFIPALIIDHDKNSGLKMGTLVKDLFHKVYTQWETKNVPVDLDKLKPAVVFLNLNVDQREVNLELADIIAKLPTPPLILGYSDSHEPELLAHALESGLQDLFMRPFDQDIIASKINKFFQHEKMIKHDLAYSPLKPPVSALVKFRMRLTGCDENGITLEGEHYISKGTTLRLPMKLANELTGDEKSEFLVVRTWTGDTWDKFFCYAELKETEESNNAFLRRFISSKVT